MVESRRMAHRSNNALNHSGINVNTVSHPISSLPRSVVFDCDSPATTCTDPLKIIIPRDAHRHHKGPCPLARLARLRVTRHQRNREKHQPGAPPSGESTANDETMRPGLFLRKRVPLRKICFFFWLVCGCFWMVGGLKYPVIGMVGGWPAVAG